MPGLAMLASFRGRDRIREVASALVHPVERLDAPAGGEVLALEGAGLEPHYRKWQITDDARLLPGLHEIAEELGSPWL